MKINSKIEHKFENKNIFEIYLKVNKAIFSEDYEVAMNLLNNLKAQQLMKCDENYDQTLHYEVNLLYIRCLSLAGKFDQALSMLKDFDNKLLPMKTDLQEYLKIRCLLIEADILKATNKNTKALSAISYGEIIATKIDTAFNSLKSELLLLKSIILLSEDQESMNRGNTILNILASQKNTTDQLSLILSGKLGYATMSKLKDIETINKIEVNLSNIDLSLRYKWFSINSIIFYYLNIGDPDRALGLINKYDEKISFPCIKNYYIFTLYKALTFIRIGELDKAENILNNIVVPENCNADMALAIEQYRNQVLFDIKNLQKKYNESISLLLRNREIASTIYTEDQELHLDDLYTLNLNDILEILNKQYGKNIPLSYHKIVSELFHDTKNREYKRSLSLSSENLNSPLAKGYNENDAKIKSLLRKANDFKNPVGKDDFFYEELYNLYKKQTPLGTELKSKIKEESLDFDFLKRELKDRNIQLLNAIKIDSIHWVYLYDGNKFSLYKLTEKQVNDLDNYLNNPFEISKKQKDRIPLLNQISQNKLLVLCLDGEFNKISFDKVNSTNYEILSQAQLINFENKFILKDKVKLFSFSNKETRKKLINQEIGDLYHDEEECIEIKKILGDKNVVFSGCNFTEKNLKNVIKDASGIHIVTHSIPDPQNRLNSYLYLRSSNGQPQKLFLSDLYYLDKSPIFVNLSSCRSALGANVTGSGTYSLSRPFFMRGAQTVIKSKVEIIDRLSMEFMSNFYEEWNGGVSCAEALWCAKEKCKNSPNFKENNSWQYFILEGNPNLYLK